MSCFAKCKPAVEIRHSIFIITFKVYFKDILRLHTWKMVITEGVSTAKKKEKKSRWDEMSSPLRGYNCFHKQMVQLSGKF